MGSKLINGVNFRKLKEIESDKGSVLHFLRNDDENFTSFGECYFSEIKPNCIKGWKIHSHQTQNLVVPFGEVKFVLFDLRENSDTANTYNEFLLGRDKNYSMLKIPTNIYYSFKNLSDQTSLIVNCPDIPHNKEESKLFDLNFIPFEWEK